MKTKKKVITFSDAQFFAQNEVKTKKKVNTFADAQFWDMKILGGMLPDYWWGYIPLWICTHGYEEVRNYRKTLFIQSIVENGWWGMHSSTSPRGSDPEFDDFFEIKITSKFFNFQVPVKKEWLKNSSSEFF